MRVDGETVMVTGGASGLGLATVEMVLAAGGRAAIVDVNEDAGNAVAARHSSKTLFVRADVTNAIDMERAVDTTLTTFGRLRGLVCAAGIAVAERVLPK